MGILDHIGKTALVRLDALCAGLPQPVFAKCEHLNPGGSIKDRIAQAIVEDAEARGLLTPGMTIIEATAGNTGMGLAILAAVKGYRLACVMPEKMSEDKRVSLRALGAQVIVTPNAPASSPDHFQHVARRLAREHGWFLADQFNNPANPEVHYHTTAAEILAQVDGPIGAFVSGAGTGGTITGVGRRLKEVYPDIKIILADPVGSGLADWVEHGELGPDGSYAVEGIGASLIHATLDRTIIDGVERVSDAQSFAMVRRLVREEGALVGGSAGANIEAALRVASYPDLKGPVVSILCDSWDRYRAAPWMQGWAAC